MTILYIFSKLNKMKKIIIYSLVNNMLGVIMDNSILNIFNSLTQNKIKQEDNHSNNIPKEVLDQYPYGQFPIRYTKVGQESIRKNSENRFSYNNEPSEKDISSNISSANDNTSTDLSGLLPIIQILTNKEHSSKDMFGILSQILLKDNPELQKLLQLFAPSKNNIKSQEINNLSIFPDTNKVSIANLKRVQ